MTLLDYLPKLPEYKANGFQHILMTVWAVVFFVWAIASFIIVLAYGGSFFDDDPKSSTSMEIIQKYSPPWWRKISAWCFWFEIGLLIILVISFFIWHDRVAA
jgi:hypothetical protein